MKTCLHCNKSYTCCEAQMFGKRMHTVNCNKGLKGYLNKVKRVFFDTGTSYGVINLNKNGKRGEIIL